MNEHDFDLGEQEIEVRLSVEIDADGYACPVLEFSLAILQWSDVVELDRLGHFLGFLLNLPCAQRAPIIPLTGTVLESS